MTIGLDGYIDERTERLYVSQEYKLFLLTGQDNGTYRKAFIAAKPFNTFDAETLAAMTANAQPLDKDSRITFSTGLGNLNIRDGFTGTTSTFPLQSLDTDVKAKLGVATNTTGLSDAWGKFTQKAVETAGTTVKAKPQQILKL